MSVIGFDIGNQSCVIASAKRGEINVLLNDESKPETPSVVSFGEKQRLLGSAGAAFGTTNPRSTVSQIKRLIGKLYKEVEEDLMLLPFVTSEGPRGGILIELEYLESKWSFTPVEILGMLFKHLKNITEKNLEFPVVDCVIGIPSYFSDLQRRLYLDAAFLAGLKPLSLMHDGTAIALGYGIYKTDFSDSGPTNVMFVDIGHTDTQVTIAGFEQGKMKILSHSFDQNLGGRDFDEVLFKHFAAQFKEKYKIDVYSNAGAYVRLRASCEKVKKVLSTNAEAPLSIDCLIGDTDVRGFITREEFEKLSSKLLIRVIIPCSMALKDSGLSIDEIDTIELVGSGSSIPAITKIITSSFDKEPKRTLNASECVARGCALRCAMLSPSFIVRDYKIEDSFPYSIVIPTQQGEIMLFPKGSPFPNKNITRHIKKIPFYVPVAYRKERDFPAGISHIVGHFAIGPSETSDAEKARVEFGVMLNDNGIVEIDSATIKSYSGTKMIGNSDMLKLPFTENVDVSTTNDELHEAMEKEKMLAEQDIRVEETKDLRNSLEYFVYDTRNKLSSTYWIHATDSEREAVTNKLQETDYWLYEDSDDESEQEYTERLIDLKKLLEPIEIRYNEEKVKAIATKPLKTCIAKYVSHADSLPADKKEKVKILCAEAEHWLSGLSRTQLSPMTLSTKINQHIVSLESKYKSIIRSKHSQGMSNPADVSTTNDELHAVKETLKISAEQDMRVEETKDQRNTLKSFVYDTRSKLSSSYKSFATDSEKEVITKKLQETEEWLYEDSDDKSEQDYTGQLKYLKKLLEPIENKYNEENAIAKAKKALQDCIAKYRSRADLLSADQREKVNNVCIDVERWLSSLLQKHLPPKMLADKINHAINVFERKCKHIIRSEPSFSRHKESVGSDPRDQPLDSENARAKAANPLYTCIANSYLLAESLTPEKKEKVKNVCREAEQWLLNVLNQKHLSVKTLPTDIKDAVNLVESECHSIISSESSFPMHEENSNPRDKIVEPDQKDQLVDSENDWKKAAKSLETCIATYRSHTESFPADTKEKVEDICMRAEQWFNSLLQNHASPNTLTAQINHIIERVKRHCESIISFHPSLPKHDEAEDTGQRNQSMDRDQTDQPATQTKGSNPWT